MQRNFTLVPSVLLFWILALLYSLAALTLLLIVGTLGLWASGIFILLVFSLLLHLKRDVRLSLANSCVALRLEEDKVVLITRSGIHQDGELLRHSLVTPFFIILNVALKGSYFGRSIVVMPDSMESESFRRLRVALRWGDLSLK